MVSTYVLYSQVNSLSEFAFIAGTSYTLNFNVYEENGTVPLDMAGGSFYWTLSPYGQNYSILEIEGEITGIGTAKVEIPSSSTETLSGKFIHQPVVVSFSGETYRPSQGVLMIIPRIPLA